MADPFSGLSGSERRSIRAWLKVLPQREAWIAFKGGLRVGSGEGKILAQRAGREIKTLTQRGFTRSEAKLISSQRRRQRQAIVHTKVTVPGAGRPTRADFVLLDITTP